MAELLLTAVFLLLASIDMAYLTVKLRAFEAPSQFATNA